MNAESIYRLLDANANRAREGIRTAEDYVRFTIGEARWARRLRALRRKVTETIQGHFSSEVLSAARRVQSDSGHPSQTDAVPSHSEAEDPRETALRGLKRAQEALRVLEEFARGSAPQAGQAFAESRFELYEAEQWLAGGSEASRVLAQAKLYVLITQALCGQDWRETARAALSGGAQVLQLREKELDGAELLDRARILKELCREFRALLIVNDRVDVALAAGADGVHLGQADLPPAEARKQAGAGLLIGRSTHSPEEARRAAETEEADYIAVGAMYETGTKAGRKLMGPPLAKAVAEMKLEAPVFAIGGITTERVKELRSVGIERVAVSSAVISSPNPERAARSIREALEAWRG